MTILRTLASALLTGAALIASALTFTFANPVLSARTGEVATFAGTLLNDGTTDLLIGGDSITQEILDPEDWQGLNIDDSFLANFLVDYPGLFPAGATWTGTLFSVAIGPTATSGSNGGNFALLNDQSSVLADQNFAITVQAVPEPAGLASLAVALVAFRRRRQRAGKLGL